MESAQNLRRTANGNGFWEIVSLECKRHLLGELLDLVLACLFETDSVNVNALGKVDLDWFVDVTKIPSIPKCEI